MGAIRVMATCMAMGEAAGRAAKQAVREGLTPATVDVRKLQEELLAHGAYLRSTDVPQLPVSDDVVWARSGVANSTIAASRRIWYAGFNFIAP